MRIACPYCGVRDVREFTYLGDATPRAPRCAGAGRASSASSTMSICATIRPALHRRALVSRRRMPGLACGDARHAHARDRRRPRLQGWPMSAAASCHFRRAAQPHRLERRLDRSLAAGARIISTARRSTASPATRSRRRCSPTASGWSAAASNIIGRAAFSPPGRKSRMRWSNCAAAPGASRTRARPRSRCSTGLRRRARTAGRRCASIFSRSIRCWRRSSRRASTTRPSCGRPRSGSASTSPSSAAPPGLGRAAAEPDPDHYEQAYAFCDVLIIGAGAAGLAAAQVAARSGARVIVCEQDFVAGGRLLADDREIGGVPGSAWAEAIVAELGGLPNVRLMPRTCVFGVYDGGVYGARRAGRRSSAGAACAPAAAAAVADHGQARHSGERRHRAAAGLSGQRPAGRDDGRRRCAAISTALPSGPGERVALFTNNDDGWRTAAALRKRGVDIAAIIDSRPEVPGHLKAQCPDARIIADAHVSGTKAAPCCARLRSTHARRHRADRS